LKIGVIASIAHALPPRNYGPWEQIASVLTEGFVAHDHEVTLFASGDSVTSARLVSSTATAYEEDRTVEPKVAGALHIAAAMERADEFDILLNEFDFVPVTYSRLIRTPMVTTIHGIGWPEIADAYRAYDDIAHYVAISEADRQPGLTYAATIPHGIDTASFHFRAEPGEYLLFLGRIHPDKGTDRAIEVARRAGLPLVIAGPVQDEAFFREQIEPQLGADIRYAGTVGPAERDALLGGALALLHLISFAEPFGLSVVESLATGTPVIATPLGSMPEILTDGVTGFLVSDVAQAVSAIGRLPQLDREACRFAALSRFDSSRMVQDYLSLFTRLVGFGSQRHTGSRQVIGSPGLFRTHGLNS
jgi:glycosyltransferase involved in cell wall biosynthesis